MRSSRRNFWRRLDHTRDSISQTVTEIKETVANQVQAVKNTRLARAIQETAVAWSAYALRCWVSDRLLYCQLLKDDDSYRYSSAIERYGEEAKSYAAQPVLGMSSAAMSAGGPGLGAKTENGSKDRGPGLF